MARGHAGSGAEPRARPGFNRWVGDRSPAGWRRAPPHPLPYQQLAHDQPGLNGLAQPHIVRNEQVHARQQQGLAKRLELVGVDLDARAVGGLKQLGVGGGDGVPAERVVVGREVLRVIELALRELGPDLPLACQQRQRLRPNSGESGQRTISQVWEVHRRRLASGG